MKYLDEFRDPVAAKTLVDSIHRTATRTWTIMEVCGGQTHSIIRNGIDQLLDDIVPGLRQQSSDAFAQQH